MVMEVTLNKSDGAKLCVVVNGPARSGKDTAVAYMKEYFIMEGFDVFSISSIEPVTGMLRSSGVIPPEPVKDEKYRKLLSDVGLALESYNHYRTKFCSDWCNSLAATRGDAVLFVHMREPELIDRFASYLTPNVIFRKVLVTRRGVEALQSNLSDSGVFETEYDYKIKNDHNLIYLGNVCRSVAGALVGETTRILTDGG